MTPGDDSATVRLVDVYGEQVRMGVQLAVIAAQLQAMADRAGDHEARIRALERWRYGLPLTSLLAVSSGIAAVWSLLHR